LSYKFKNVAVTQKLHDVPDVMGDPGRLEQVIINVLSNSVEAMTAGGEIIISSLLEGGSVRIHVTDSGPGISEEHLSRVFDPFFTTKEIGAGTGLGLSISYGIIKQHRGSIDFVSTLGTGTKVTISLPTKEQYEKNTGRR
jgi:signal transduction histidine kinase